ncbi:hypothetical protein CYMTET_20634 [Cymbomonas tetramitiformis]|uniref:Uncharacterized protein n=1 Tax=Cymbomonas tetramitiformis TaxID=36881 RepID=A0AAE0L405_9CHLO|nr:hypothetical protein CYMTET_20634 [Cymbomonas tetramitiformis]
MTQPPTDPNTAHSWFPETSCHEQLPTFHKHTSPPSRTLAGERDDIFQELDQYGSMFGRLVRNHDSQALEVGTSDRSVPGVLENMILEDFDQYGSMCGRISRTRESEALELVTSEPTGELNNLNLQEAGEYGTLFERLLPRSCSELLERCSPGRDEVCSSTHRLILREFPENGIEGSVKVLEPETHSIEAKLREKMKEEVEERSGNRSISDKQGTAVTALGRLARRISPNTFDYSVQTSAGWTVHRVKCAANDGTTRAFSGTLTLLE